MSLMKSFLSYKKPDKFQAEKFLTSGYLMAKIQEAVSYKLVSYMQVLTVSTFSSLKSLTYILR